MKTLAAVVLCAVSAFAQGVGGHWNVSMETPHGLMNGSLDFQQDGSKLKGTLALGQLGSFTLKGSVDGASVKFEIQLPDGGETLTFTGRLDGGKISGTTDPHQFKWEASRAVVGTLIEFRSHPVGFGLKADGGETIFFQVSPETQVFRVPPGEHDLAKAKTGAVTDLAIGDRLLVTFAAGMTEARRIVRIAPGDIARRNESERQDWRDRGISGIVTGKTGDGLTLDMQTAQGKETIRLTTGAKTSIRRYAPDSVKFSDARPSSLAEIETGDQVLARGTKSGSQFAADDLVFGTFVTIVGQITSVNADAGEVQIRDLKTKTPLTIRVAADSRIKKMPEMQEMMGHMSKEAPPAGADMTRMLEALPACNIENLRTGTMLVATATRGLHSEAVTAILLVAGIDGLIQMAQAQPGSQGLKPVEALSRMHHGLMDGPGGFTLPGIIQ